jgi:4-amino-4-deoxy-L-arabinose transferase-like glycosyltransferase
LFSSRPFNDSLKTWNWVVIITANVALCVLVAGSPHHPVYDEQWFLDTLDLLNRQGLSLGFLREFPGAAGPTFTLLFAAIDRVLTLSFPWLRFANVALLAAAATLIWRILAASPERNKDAPSPALLAASLTTLPTVGVSAGMALTEMPALFFVVVSVLLLTLARAPNAKSAPSWLAAIGCGTAAAVAVLGRQNYLVVLPALTLAFGWPPACRRHDLTRIAVIGAVVVVIAGPVFIVWGGLIPPKSAWSGDGFSAANAVRSAGYAGIIVLLFAPEIFRVLWQRKRLLAAAALASIPLLLATGGAPIPMASLVRPLFSEQLTAAIATGFGFLLSLSAICFVGSFVFYCWQERTNWLTRFAGSTALLGILSNAKITHQFSSRYVLVFLPFIVLATAPAVRTNWHQPLRLALGACISLGALASYYFGQ